MNTLEKLLDTFSIHELKKIKKTLGVIDSKYSKYENIDIRSYKAITESFKERYQETGDLDALLPDAYALVKAVIKKMTGKSLFDTQLTASCILNDGNIAEMKTGEGKTLALIASAYLNSLTGKGVHIVTSNEYLAQRDSEEVKGILNMLGVSVGCAVTKDEEGNVLSGKEQDNKLREEFKKDIVYTTPSALAFSYLKDNAVNNKKDKILRGLNYVILDEIDSSLIDDAKNPFVLSGNIDMDDKVYVEAQRFVESLKNYALNSSISSFSGNIQKLLSDGYLPKNNYHFDSYSSFSDYNADITDEGLKKFYRFLRLNPELQEFRKIKIKDKNGIVKVYGMDYKVPEDRLEDIVYDGPNTFLMYVKKALIATNCYQYGKDYEIIDGEIKLVDSNTARILPDSKLEQGLHQAIEAKERLSITSETRSIGSITYPSFFKLYTKRSGLSGTVKQAEKEFNKLYSLGVVQVPRRLPSKRKDLGVDLYSSSQEKYEAIINQVLACKRTGQPIIVGVDTVEDCEKLSRILKVHGIVHNSLSARNDFEEAKVIGEAGRLGAVTIVTPMAGRGTDIKLGGTVEDRILKSDAMRTYAIKSIDVSDVADQAKYLYRAIHIDSSDSRKAKQDRERIRALEKGTGSTAELIRYNKEVTDLKKKMINHRADEFLAKCQRKAVSSQEYVGYLTVYNREKAKATEMQRVEAKQVNALGGLYILGTEISRSSRVQDQLIGRCARNGENGKSKFIVSLDDNFFKNGLRPDKLAQYKAATITKGSKLVQQLIDKIQLNISSDDERSRESQYRLDAIDDKDRTAYYKFRDEILECDDMEVRINSLMDASINRTIDKLVPSSDVTEKQLRAVEAKYMNVLTTPECFKDTNITKDQLKLYLKTSAHNRLRLYKTNNSVDFERLAREKTLKESDDFWCDFVDSTKDRHRIASLNTQALTEHGSSHGDMYTEYEFIAEESFREFVDQFMSSVTRSFMKDANKYIRKTSGQVQRVTSEQNVNSNDVRKR